MEQQLKQWVVDSTTLLDEAKQIGVQADGYLRVLKSVIDDNNLLVLRINYMISFLKDQIGLMSKIFNKLKSFNGKFQEKLKTNLNYFGELIGQLNHCLTELNSIQVDKNLKSFLSKNNTNYQSDNIISLYDYLSLEEFLKLQQNYEIFIDNLQTFDDYLLKNQLNFFESNLINFNNYCQTLVNEFNNINKYFYKDLVELNLYSADNKNTSLNTNEKYSILINYYEFDMADSIHGLANHYDKCNEALLLFTDDKHEQLGQLINVLQNDSLEAPNALNELKLLFFKIEKLNNNKNLFNLNENLKKIYQDLIINNFVANDFLTKTNRNLNIEFTIKNMNNLNFNFLKNNFVGNTSSAEVNLINLDLQENIAIISKLLDFLKGFKSSYFKLIVQVDKNATINLKVRKLINNFLAKLNVLESENIKFNDETKKEIKNYLPSDLSTIVYNSGEGRKNLPNVEVISQFEEFPEIDKSFIEFAKKQISP